MVRRMPRAPIPITVSAGPVIIRGVTVGVADARAIKVGVALALDAMPWLTVITCVQVVVSLIAPLLSVKREVAVKVPAFW